MATIVYGTSPNRSNNNQNQYSSYSSINKTTTMSILNQTSTLHHHQHHHMSQPLVSTSAAPLSVYQMKEHHSSFYSRNWKRKSAVEMLAESKPYYVKSDQVLDRHQQLNARSGGNNTMSCEFLLFKILKRFFFFVLMIVILCVAFVFAHGSNNGDFCSIKWVFSLPAF